MRTNSARILRSALSASIDQGTLAHSLQAFRLASSAFFITISRCGRATTSCRRKPRLGEGRGPFGSCWAAAARQDARGRRVGAQHRDGFLRRSPRRGADRARGRDARRCAERDGRGRVGSARRACAGRAAALRAVEAHGELAERRGGATLLGGRAPIVCAARNSPPPGATSSANGRSPTNLGHAAIRA